MRKPPPLCVSCALAAASCAPVQPAGDATAYADRMNASGQRYVACVTAEAEKEANSPAGAEDIAVAAHARCWLAWEAYRKATAVSYLEGATTREELQLAQDKADAHLRQFERETRRTLVERVVERSLRRPTPSR